jgi:hypothetical protein
LLGAEAFFVDGVITSKYTSGAASHMSGQYKAPDLPREKVTPVLVRDELLRCFESANKEFMDVLNQPTDDMAIKAQVRQFVSGSFQNCGASFDQPTKQGIVKAIGECKANAEAMMGEKGSNIIRHHYNEMMKLVDKLPDNSRP